MMHLIIKLVVLAVAIWIISFILPGVRLKNFKAALVVGGVFSLLNWVVFKLLFIFTIPLQILTLGLFGLVMNVVLLRVTDSLLDDFELSGWGSSILAAIGISVVNALLWTFLR